jgi:hypothetical protein
MGEEEMRLEDRITQLEMMMKASIRPNTEQQNIDAGKWLYNFRKNRIELDPVLNDEAHHIWFILGILAYMLDPSLINSSVFAQGVPLDKQLEDHIKSLINASQNKKELAVACCKLHKQLCGHCACW